MLVADELRPKSLEDLAREAQGKDPWACPRCGCRMWEVKNTWRTVAGLRRKRVCRHCGQGFLHTTETPG